LITPITSDVNQPQSSFCRTLVC